MARARTRRGARARGARGLTLLETTGVLAVSTLVVASSAALFHSARDASRDGRTVMAVGDFASSARALAVGAPLHGAVGSNADLTDLVVEAGAAPPSVRVTDSGAASGTAKRYGLFHPHGGQILSWSSGETFVVVADALDDDACLRVATAGSSRAMGGGAGPERMRIGPSRGSSAAAYESASAIPASLDLNDLFDATLTAGRASPGDGLFLAAAGHGVSGGLPVRPAEADASCSGGRGGNAVSWLFR